MARNFLGFHPTFWPTVFTVPALALLIALGVWQLERLNWKLGVIHNIQERASAAPMALPPNDRIDADALEYRRVRVSGRFQHDKELHLLSHTYRGNLGYHLYVPLVRSDGGTVLINRGWVPADRKDAASRLSSQPAGEVTVDGFVRKGWPRGWFVPENEPAKNLWFYGDLAAMQRTAGITAPPIFVEAGPTPEGTLPIGGQTRLEIPNNHLQYALTWFGFAVLLAVIYVLYHRKLKSGT